ncbi:MAG: NADH-quinone oxidoreductase subunit NuoG [Roseiflexaceae bacterium]|nr:NADH-quinone oxidoreductase subunit NuoG [Roseiflexaceae bacterium]
MPDVSVTIDGTQINVPVGTNVVDAARLAGVAVPVFCYHPKMKPVGMCRMCLVEVYTPKVDPATRQVVMGEDGKPVLALMMNKLQTGCTTPISEGMVVNTASDRVKFAQKGVLEFLLTSHPLDCPVCDKGGECPLQNLTMQWGPDSSRFDYEDKIHFEKPIPLGDLILLDRERCILCSRCVRFEDELADDNVLGFGSRGRSWEIISKSTPAFDSKFSGNTTDICPVGALTSSDFRFKARVWELKSTPSVCNLCPVGCNTSLDMRYNELMRVMPRENDAVNEIWVCDKGRYGHRYAVQENRLTTPLIKRNGEFVSATWEQAYSLIAERLGSYSGAQVAGLAGPKLPNEDLFSFARLFRENLGSNNLDHRPGSPADLPLDDLPRTYGVGKGTNLMTLGKGTAVLVIGADPEEEAPLYQLRLRAIAQRGGDLTVVSGYPTKLERSATRKVRVKPGTEAQFALALVQAVAAEKLASEEVLGSGRLKFSDEYRRVLAAHKFDDLVAATGLAREVVITTAKAFASAEHGIIVYGRSAAADPAIPQALAAFAALTGKLGKANSGLIALRPGGNFRGALDMGVRPDAAGQPGLSAQQVWQQAGTGVKAVYIAALNPAAENPAAAQALQKLDFVVVQDLFLTETAQYADVVLPAAAVIEREGTFTNAERREQRFRQARQAPANLPADWQSFQAVAQLLAERAPVAVAARTLKKGAKVFTPEAPQGWTAMLTSDVNDMVTRSVSGYNAASYSALSTSRGAWGRQPNEAVYYDGTSYENTEGVGIQIAASAEDSRTTLQLNLSAPALRPVGELVLLPVARAYDGGDWVRGSKLSARQVPAHIIMSVADTARLDVGIGELVTVSSAAGSITLPVQIETGLDLGVALLPEVRGSTLGALLTGAQTAITVVKA